MAFTDVEMAILSQLSYCDMAFDNSEQKTLYSFLKDKEKYLKKELGDEYISAMDSLMKKVKGKDYVIVHSIDDEQNAGFAAMAIKDSSNEVTVVTRGTEGFAVWKEESRKDVIEDISLAIPTETNQQQEMAQFMEELQTKGDFDGFYFTGHSLGGNLALYGSIMLVDPNLLKGCRTYNAPGFNSVFMIENVDKYFFIQNKIINYQNENDGVSNSFVNPPGKTVILECKGLDILHPLGLDAHGIDHFKIGKGGEFVRNFTGIKNKTVIGELLEEVTNLSDIVVFLGNAIINGWNSVVGTIRKIVYQHYIASHSYIKVDTAALRRYASRIAEVNRRMSIADQKMDKLYWSVGLFDLWNLVKADAMTSESWRLKKCQNYLIDTAVDFEKAETAIATQ